MNAYWCSLEERIVGRSYDPPDPGEPYFPCGIYLAETRGQAKRMLLDEHDRVVERDEYIDVRSRLLERGVEGVVAGPLPEPRRGEPNYERMARGDDPDPRTPYARLWLRVHEVLDHAGRSCDCPAEVDIEAEAA